MRLTKKQQEEIHFLSQVYKEPFEPTEEEIAQFIEQSVQGVKHDRMTVVKNRLLANKRSLEIMIPMWTEDLKSGLLDVEELKWNDPYGNRLVDAITKGITKDKAFMKENVFYLKFAQRTKTLPPQIASRLANFLEPSIKELARN